MNHDQDLLHFDAFSVALELIRAVKPLLGRIGKSNPDLVKQLRRAADSIALNVAEGRRRAGGNRTQLWRVAAGSNDEVRACLYVAHAWGSLDDSALDKPMQLIDRLGAMLYRLTH